MISVVFSYSARVLIHCVRFLYLFFLIFVLFTDLCCSLIAPGASDILFFIFISPVIIFPYVVASGGLGSFSCSYLQLTVLFTPVINRFKSVCIVLVGSIS